MEVGQLDWGGGWRPILDGARAGRGWLDTRCAGEVRRCKNIDSETPVDTQLRLSYLSEAKTKTGNCLNLIAVNTTAAELFAFY